MAEAESFSNPLPPAHEEYIDQDEDDYESAHHRLTNDDFRKLLMTPRVPAGGSVATPASAPRPAPVASKPVVSPTEDENDPAVLRKKRKSFYAKLKKEEELRSKELAERYRDRARERRDGSNKDYEVTTEVTSTTADYRAVAPDAKRGEDYAERRKQVIQESKYLGGDMEHTHLVKGLDYALLEKVKAEITNKEQEEPVETVAKPKQEKEEDIEDMINFRTKLGRNVFRTIFATRRPERNELYMPKRMAYVYDLEDEFNETDIPTTLIRSKADCPTQESTTTNSDNDVVINKLTQILSYLRQGRRDRKKKKDKGKTKDDEKLKMVAEEAIYSGVGEYNPVPVKPEKEKDRGGDRERDRRDRDRDRDRRDRDHQEGRPDYERDRGEKKKSYFEKPLEEEENRDLKKNKISAKDLVKQVNDRFGKSWAGTEAADSNDKLRSNREEEQLKKLKSRTEIDSYAECYPGMMESADAIDDSDDEVDYTKMDQGNKKGPVGRWDFDTQEEYSDYMSNKEALPKAAFQYGVKMADGRKTRRAGPKDDKKELDREWQKIQNIIAKRKPGGPPMDEEPSAKSAKY